MARIFQQRFTKKGITKKARTWSISFKEHMEIRQTVSGFVSHRVAETIANKLETLAGFRVAKIPPSKDLSEWLETIPPKLRDRLIKIGLISSEIATTLVPLKEHLEDFHKSLLAKGNTKKHANMVRTRVETILDECNFVHWQDIKGSILEERLAEMRHDQKT